MTDVATLAYLAGAIDSDGFISIRKSTYHQRVRHDANNALYQERIGLKQVTPDIPRLLADTFGGSFLTAKPGTGNSRPLFGYNASDKRAAEACRLLLPHLRVKRRQAELVLELRASKEGGMWRSSHWFLREFPNWQELELVTLREAAAMLGHTHHGSIGQAVRNGTLVALPYDYTGTEKPRVPRLLVEMVARQAGKDGRARNQAPELVALREGLYQQVRELNKIGVNGTPVYFRTGPYEAAK